MAEQPKYFDIEDTQTGKKYRIETDDPKATYDEAVEYFSSLPETEWQQYEYNVPAPAASAPAPVVAPAPRPDVTLSPGVESQPRRATKAITTPVEYDIAANQAFTPPEEVRTLTPEQEAEYVRLVEDPSISIDTLNQYLTRVGADPISAPEDVANIQRIRELGGSSGVVSYQNPFEGLQNEEYLQSLRDNTDDSWGSQFGRSLLNAWSDPATGSSMFARGVADLFDVGMEDIKQRFPNATPAQLEDLQTRYVAFLNRKVFEAREQGIAQDDFIPWIAGQFSALDFVDIVPVGRAARAGTRVGRVAEKTAEAATLGGLSDLAFQGAAISAGAQDEFDPIRTAMATGLSGAFGTAAQGVAEIAPGVKVNTPETAPPSGRIVVPTSRKNSKKYMTELDGAATEMVAQVNELAKGWSNAPNIEVHNNFSKLDGVSDTAIGVYTEKTLDDGTKVPVVQVNAEAVLARAKQRDVSPESVVEAVTFHEALGHHGLTQLFREDLDAFLDDIYTNGTEQFRDLVDDWLRKNPNSYKNYSEDSRRILATEEVMAEWSEKEGLLPKSWYDDLANRIKGFARQTGMNLKYSEREVRSYLAVAQRRVTEGTQYGAVPSAPRNIDEGEGVPGGVTSSGGFRIPKPDSRMQARDRKLRREVAAQYDPFAPPEYTRNNNKYMEGDNEFLPVGVVAANENIFTGVTYDKKGKPVLPARVMGPEEAYKYYSAMAEWNEKRALRFVGSKAYDRYRDSAEKNRLEAEKRLKEGFASRYGKQTSSVRPTVKQYKASLDASSRAPSNDKYMEGDGPIDPDNLTADDLIEARNALDILNRLDYTPPVVSPDQLEAEAIARNLPPSDITRLVGIEPGKLMKKLFLYDVAATKLSDRAAKIKADIDANGLTPEKQAAYIEATMTLSDLTSRIFDFQGEIGRTLAANRRVNFSRKRVRDLKSVLEKYGAEALADPETFMKYMAEVEAKAAKKDGKAQFGTGFAQYVNIPRAIMSSADLSAPLRQGIVFVGYKEFWKSFAKMFSLFGKSGETNYNFLMKKIATDPNYELMLKARLQFSSLDGELTAREEDFQTELARKIPLFGKVVKGSEQAYAGFLNKLRADMFNRFVKEYKHAGVELDEEGLKGLGRFINAATGRAELPEFLKPSSTILNATFFSARLMHSRVQMLNPAFYAKLPAPVRKSAGKAMLRFGSIALLVNGALNALFPEVETETDPRSSDFMKVKVGNTRFDLGGGFNQYLILGARTGTWLYNQSLGFGERMTGIDTTDYKVSNKKTVGGDYRDFGAEGVTQDTYGSVLADFFRSKLSPQASYVVDFLNEEDYIGRPFTVEGSLASRLVPMTASSVYEAYAEDSPVPMPVIFTATLFGVGTNTYTAPGLDPKRELEAPLTFEMSDLEDGQNDFIRAEGGVVTLKKPARDAWTATLNNYYPVFIQEVSGEMGLKFEEMDDNMKKATVKEALKRTRAAAKKDMMYELGLE